MTGATVRYLLIALFNPFFITLLLLSLSVLWLIVRGNHWLVRVGLLLSLLSFIVLSTPWFPDRLLASIEHQYDVVREVNPAISWVVVLGGGHEDIKNAPANDELSSQSIARLVEGIRLYRQLSKAKLLLSGGSGYKGDISEANYLGVLASWCAIPSDALVLESDSFNTADEALYIKQMVKTEPFYLVTSAVHMRRAMALFLRQGLHPIAAPTDFSSRHQETLRFPNPHNLVHVNTVWHEKMGMIWAKLRGEV